MTNDQTRRACINDDVTEKDKKPKINRIKDFIWPIWLGNRWRFLFLFDVQMTVGEIANKKLNIKEVRECDEKGWQSRAADVKENLHSQQSSMLLKESSEIGNKFSLLFRQMFRTY